MNKTNKTNQTEYELANTLVKRVGKSLFIAYFYSGNNKNISKIIEREMGYVQSSVTKTVSTARRIINDPVICKQAVEIICKSKMTIGILDAAKSIKIGQPYNTKYGEIDEDKNVTLKNLIKHIKTQNINPDTEIKGMLTNFSHGFHGRNENEIELFKHIKTNGKIEKSCKTFGPGDLPGVLMEYLYYGEKPTTIERGYFESLIEYNNKLMENKNGRTTSEFVKEPSLPSEIKGLYFYKTLKCLNISARQSGILKQNGVQDEEAARMIYEFIYDKSEYASYEYLIKKIERGGENG